MCRILINDGIHPSGLRKLQEAGFKVETNKIDQEDLPLKLNDFDAICVRSATKVRKELIDLCPNLKAIARGGVGLDNIDVKYAKDKGIAVYNTPAASSRSVAELAFAHLLSVSRSLYYSNRDMPSKGANEFKSLKKLYSKGHEIENKTLGIIGMGRIGQETAKIALGLGMNVIAVDPYIKEATIEIGPAGSGYVIPLKSVDMDEMLSKADYISLHIPFMGDAILSDREFDKMKDGVVIINCARGGTLDEAALIRALNSGKVSAAGLDVFENEPNPSDDILHHSKVSLTPHIGASTIEAQEKIGLELADLLINHFSKVPQY
jgi:D-3-phosphoglycerate dehydrogenase